MQTEKAITENKPKHQVFTKRMEFYWQFIVIYFVVFFIIAILKGSIDEGTLSITLKDPVVLLLGLFFLVTLVQMSLEYLKKKSLVIGRDYIIFKTRFREKKYSGQDIQRITLGKERFLNMKASFRLIKFKIINRPRVIRVRPTSYVNDAELLQAIVALKRHILK